MAADDTKSLIQNFQRDIDTGQASILDTYIGSSYNDHNPPPFAATTPGMAGLKETFNIGLDIFSEFTHVVEDQISEGDKVATRITGSGKHVGQFLNIPPTNKMITMSGIAIHRVDGGKLVEHWGQVDAIGLLTQMGAFPAPPNPPAPAAPPVERRPDDAVMSPDRIKEALQRIFDQGFNERRRQVIEELLDPAYVNYSMPAAPGPKGFTQIVETFFRAFPDLHVTVDDMIAENDKVASRGHITGTHKGHFMNVPPTGKTIDIGFIDIWKVQNGRFIENWVQMDMLGALVQLGAVPPPQA